MRVLIAGCGDVGGALARRLVAADHEVWGLRRRIEGLPEGVRGVAADLTTGQGLEQLEGPFDRVVYCAAAGERDPEGYRAAYVTGQRRLAAALTRAGGLPERWLFTSSTGVYGQEDGSWVDEQSPTEPTSWSGRIMLEAEALAADLPTRSVIVRLAGIYGPGRRRLLQLVAGGGSCRAQPPVYGNRIHRDDCVGVLHHLMELPDPAPLYLAVDNQPAPLHEVYCLLAEEMGLPEPFPSQEDGRRGNKRCSNRLLTESGYLWQVPGYQEGYPPLVRAFRQGIDPRSS